MQPVEIKEISFFQFNNNIKTGIGLIIVFSIINFFSLIPYAVKVNFDVSINNFISFVIIGSFVDEVVFRGVILQKIQELMPSIIALFITSIFSMLLHFQGEIAFNLRYLGLALIYGYAFNKSNSLWTCIFIHSIYDFWVQVLL